MINLPTMMLAKIDCILSELDAGLLIRSQDGQRDQVYPVFTSMYSLRMWVGLQHCSLEDFMAITICSDAPAQMLRGKNKLQQVTPSSFKGITLAFEFHDYYLIRSRKNCLTIRIFAQSL